MKSKDKIAIIYSEFVARQSRGEYWFQQMSSYISPSKIIIYSLAVSKLLPYLNYILIIILVTLFTISEGLIKYLVGRIDEKWGLWKKQSEYSAKKDHISPVNVEIIETLKVVCQKLGIQHQFKEL